MIEKRKVVLVGTGFVGMSMAYSLLNQGGINELVLIDVLKEKAVGEAMDLAHGIPCAPARIDIKAGDYDVTAVDQELASIIPSPLDMGAVYQRLIRDTIGSKEDYVDGIMKVYNNEICDVIDNYNCSAFYEPSYVIARAYQNGGF